MGCKQPAGGEVVMTTWSIVMCATRFCPFCSQARQLFSQKGWEHEEIAMDWDPVKRVEMVEKAGQLYHRFGSAPPLLVAVMNC